jgi:hypothetical protein
MSTVNEYRRAKAWMAGKEAALEGASRTSCNREAGTIYFDDWHDGFDEGERELAKVIP